MTRAGALGAGQAACAKRDRSWGSGRPWRSPCSRGWAGGTGWAGLGGMVGRMALMLAAVLVGVLVLGLPRLPLVVSLLAYFALFLAMELAVQHQHARRSAEAR